MISVRQATREDPETGIREVAEFVGDPGEAMFGFAHLPKGRAVGGVVICSPLYAEFIKNYRREVIIGRTLAARGIAVQRFHYRGYGNSFGRKQDATYDALRDDAVAAAHHLATIADTDRLAFIGSRFGALVAASAAARFEGSPLVLWDPVLDPARYLRDVFRAGRIQSLAGGKAGVGGAAMQQELETHGAVHVLGYTITRTLFRSAQGRTLEGELGTSPRRVLLLGLGQDPRGHPALSSAVDRWKDAGLQVDDGSVATREAWWFTSGPSVADEALPQAIDLTVEWLSTVFQEMARSR
jgi:pimeloyl-ACP methyl ester carboxylesterase